MRWILTLMAVATFAAACSGSEVSPSTTVPTTAPACTSISILALGDSYTAGTGIESGSWPEQLAVALSDECDEVDIETVADDGWNSKRLSREIDQADVTGTRDLIILAVGANDVVLGFGEENFREGLELLGAQISELSTDATELVMLSIPDFRVSPWGQERLDRDYPIERHNEILREFAESVEATFIDITTTSARGLEDPELIAPDDLHFSAKMYALWVEQIMEVITVR